MESFNSLRFTGFDQYLFREGTDFLLYRKLGAHTVQNGRERGVRFALWAPHAQSVSLLMEGKPEMPLQPGFGGVFELFLPGDWQGTPYRYAVTGEDGVRRLKADPFAFRSLLRPRTESVVQDLPQYPWTDEEWLKSRAETKIRKTPVAIYEIHPGSWKKDYSLGEDGFLNYRTLADQLAEYLNFMGYTHVELMGISEHPFDASWGYQVTGYFSPTARYGTPEDFCYFVDRLHAAGIGVILDFVPAHFPKDSFGLERFDGTPLYEPGDPALAEYPEWGTYAFDHSKGEVRSFLISSAMYWIKEFHVDAIRVDAVAAMLYTGFGRSEGKKNQFGNYDNLNSIAFLQTLNRIVRENSTAFTVAEDSSIMAGITKPVDEGGIGFTFKWNMGWMNETLRYLKLDPVYRTFHHDLITHPADYAFLEQYVLPLSHDEVVHLKGSMANKAPGSAPDRLGTLKALLTYQFTHPGKKLLFMGQDFGQEREWSEDRQIDWELADDFGHRDVMECTRRLLRLYKEEPCLYVDSGNPATLEWICRWDADGNRIAYLRRNPWDYHDALLVVINFSPVRQIDTQFGIPIKGKIRRLFSTYDSLPGGGSPEELGKEITLTPTSFARDGYPYSVFYSLRPFEAAVFRLPSKRAYKKAR